MVAFKILSLALKAFLFLPLMEHTHACSGPPLNLHGPFFHHLPGVIGNNPSLWTTSLDANILLGSLTSFDPSDGSNFKTNVTISLNDGSVAVGWPADAQPTVPPPLLVDPSGGAEFFVANGTATLLKEGDMVYSIDLNMPEYFVAREVGALFFIDNERAHIFYTGDIPCDAPGAMDTYDVCTPSCLECQASQDFTATIDLITATVIRTGDPIELVHGVILFEPGPYNSLSKVWHDIQIANIGVLDSCGGTGYFLYDVDGFVTEALAFEPGYLYAMDANEEYVAYAMRQAVGVGDTLFIESFVIVKFNMITGEELETVPVNTTVLWALSGVPLPKADFGGTTGPTPTPAPTETPMKSPATIIPTPLLLDEGLEPTTPPLVIYFGTPSPTNAPTSTQTTATLPANLSPTTETPVQRDEAPVTPQEPTRAPPPATMTFDPQLPRECSAHAMCSGLANDCCPSNDNVMLECCGMSQVQLNCKVNPVCDGLGLEGACCPTQVGVYLDCCAAVPDKCGDGKTENCTVVSALEFMASQETSNGSSTVLVSSRLLATVLLVTTMTVAVALPAIL